MRLFTRRFRVGLQAPMSGLTHASRRHHPGKKNFAAFVSVFGLGPLHSPMDVYRIGLGTCWSAF